AEQAAAEQAAAEQAAAEQAAAEQAAAEQAAAEQAAAEQAAAEQAETVTEETPSEDDLAKALAEEEAASAEAEAAPEATAETTAEPEATAEPEVAAETTAEPEATTEAEVMTEDADLPSEDDLAKALAAEEEAAAEDPAATEEAATEETAVTEEPAASEETATAEDTTEPAPATAEETAAPAVAPGVAEVAAELAAEGIIPSTEVVPPLPEQPAAETGEAPVAEAATLLATPAEGEAAAPADVEVAEEAIAQVTEELVTDDTVRSSSEDFGNKVNQAATAQSLAATAGAAKVKKRKKGLSDFEKLAILGMGAMVVGAIISNNRKVEMNSGDRVVVSRNGNYTVIKDDDALLRQPGSKVLTETFRDGSTRTTVTRADGTRIVTIRDAEMRVLRRVHIDTRGRETLLIDDIGTYEPVVVSRLPQPRYLPEVTGSSSEDDLRAALAEEASVGRHFSLAQIRSIAEVRAFVPVIDLDAITFETGSAAIRPDQAKSLARLGKLIHSMVEKNPREVFLIEGHTDAVGSAAYNLALSDRRAESVALALNEYFGVPTENMVVQGYGEEFLKIQTEGEERQNRRASVRRITELLK
ncbi:MAG: OmpA family protein, partial [Paracoccaceae bacterium]